MKKSTLLSLLTTAAIITTTAGTYASWDNLTNETSSKVTFTKPVTITSGQDFTLLETSRILNEYPVASSDITFKVQNDDSLVNTLTITPSISCEGEDPNNPTIDDFEIKLKNAVTKADISGDQKNGFKVLALNSSQTKYTVEVKAKTDKPAGKNVTVKLTAKLSKESTPPQAAEGTH